MNYDFENITRDHFLAKSRGNSFVKNKVFCCRSCNIIKGDKSIDEFKDFIISTIKKILSDVVKQEWKISKKQILKFKKYTIMLKTVNEIINNNYEPLILFT
jgi:hypothetical protein